MSLTRRSSDDEWSGQIPSAILPFNWSECVVVKQKLAFPRCFYLGFLLVFFPFAGCDPGNGPTDQGIRGVADAEAAARSEGSTEPTGQLARASAVLEEFEAACGRVAPIWPVELCGELVLVHPQTGLAVANRPDPAGAFEAQEGVFVGEWPADMGVANTAFEWDGEWWAMVMLPVSEDRFSRLMLLAHESFHRIQPALGHVVADPMARHLDEQAARVWLRLELRALVRALAEEGEAARQAARDALLFRQVRHDSFPDAVEVERQLEAHEGLAEYTGARFALDATGADASVVADRVARFEHRPTYVRSLGYGTGPALGLLLDRYAPGWRDALEPRPALASHLADALNATQTGRGVGLLERAERRAAAYDVDDIRVEEAARAKRLADERARYQAELVDGPVLAIEAPELRLMFNPNTVLPLGEEGDVYPGAILMGPWGRLTMEEGGALAPAGRNTARVAAPRDSQPDADGILHGEGWTLELESGWRLAPGDRDGDYRVVAEEKR
jgi:hypothetical protein